MSRLLALLVVGFAIGCERSHAASSEPESSVAFVSAPATTPAAASEAASFTVGQTLGTPPTAWQVNVSGGPSFMLTGGELDPSKRWREWVSPPAITAFRVEVEVASGRLRLQQIERNIGQSTIPAFGPMASYSGIQGQGTWAGRTLDLTPIP